MPRLVVRHTTTYRYRRPVVFGPHRLMIRPRDGHDLRVVESELTLSPPAVVRWTYDVFGNSIATAQFATPAATLRVDSRLVLDRFPGSDSSREIDGAARTYPFSYSNDDSTDLGALRMPQWSDPDRRLARWTADFVAGKPTDTLALLSDISAGISTWVFYQSREDEGTQTPLETLDRGWGSCRDLAVLLMEAVRHLGFGARIVSGYHAGRIPGLAVGTPGSTHAWVEIFVPGPGWIAFDPTNRTVGDGELVPIARARSISQVVPVAGSFTGVGSDFLGLDVAVTVRPD
ncbi:MAG: transglutaminase family protein [Ancalomicrobiaceae bacterium]|nr:transglutaminase family protein [Ancalomicrobiaceae bacterium]